MECLPQYRAAEELERYLGVPSFAQALELDEREEFPEPLVAQLRAWGYLARMVPRALGGGLGSFEEAAALQRAVSRRDLTAAIALGQSFLGSAAVWLAGSPEQQRRQAELLLKGELAALALTEEAHGADVLASDVTATPTGSGVVLNGTKWLINNGTRAASLTVFARDAGGDGLGGFSLFLVEKGAGTPLPKQRTHGIRGADISGVQFNSTPLSNDARIGPAGAGADLLLQTLQLTRIGCCSFSLGAADTALRIAVDFALSRRLYGARVWDIPHARATLAGAFVDLLIADCVATAAARAVHAAPEQLSLISSIAKVFVPTLVERVLGELATILGARHYLRGGMFQKILRDAAVVPLFDGSVPINLDNIGTQLFRLSPRHAASPSERERALKNIFCLDTELPPLDPSRLALLNGGRDDVTQGCELLSDDLATALAELGGLDRKAAKRSAELFDLARRHCTLFAAACCVHLTTHSRGLIGDYVNDGGWLELALDRLRAPRSNPALAVAAEELLRRCENDLAFTMAPLQLARSRH